MSDDSLTAMDRVMDAIAKAGKGDPGDLAAAALECERALLLPDLEAREIAWFEARWMECAEALEGAVVGHG